jgi:hypothetical protein
MSLGHTVTIASRGVEVLSRLEPAYIVTS